MSTLTDALAEFVDARNHYTACVGLDVPEEEQDIAARRLARAGDAYESALSQFTQEQIRAANRRSAVLPFMGGEG